MEKIIGDVMFSALKKGKQFAITCDTGAIGTVHSVFDKALNIQLGKTDNLLTLLHHGIDIMEATCTIAPTVTPFHQRAKVGANVIFTQNVVYIANIPFCAGIQTAQTWASLSHMPYKTNLTYQQLAQKCVNIATYLNKHDTNQHLWPADATTFDPVGYIGLGTGLTPSGDDFLAGMLYAMHFFEEMYSTMVPLLAQVEKDVMSNINNTNQISRHFLRYALANKPSQNTESFLTALFGENAQELTQAIDKKIAYGASSGVDELQGCIFGLTASIEAEGCNGHVYNN